MNPSSRRDAWHAIEEQYILKYIAYRFTFEEMSILLPIKAPVLRHRSKDAIAKRSRALRERYELNKDSGQLNILKLWLLLATQGFADFNLDATEIDVAIISR